MPGPLEGIRVIDLTTVISGPVCTMILADQGADVVKVEPPGGEIARRTAGDGEFTAMFVSANRGKRSIALDLKQPAALQALRRLIARADVLVQNFRPGTMERLGLGEPALRATNPGLIYVSISGVGDTGPYVKKRVYDPVIQSLSGLADLQADQQTGRPNMIRTIVADKTTAVYAAQSICAALVARGRTGQGQHIRLSMLDTMVAFLWPEAMTQYTVVGQENAPQPRAAPRPDLQDPGWLHHRRIALRCRMARTVRSHRPSRLDRRPALQDARRAIAERRGPADPDRRDPGRPDTASNGWIAWTRRRCRAPPSSVRAEVMNDVQVVNNGLIELLDQPTLGTVRQPRPAARFDGTPARIGGPAPRIGQHTDAILAEAGYADDEIQALKTSRAAKAAG